MKKLLLPIVLAFSMIMAAFPVSALGAPLETATTSSAADVVEFPKETCEVDYSVEQSEGVTYDGHKLNGDVYELYYTIGENADENIVIDIAYGIISCANETIKYIMPGDTYKYHINITNKSQNTYVYKDNSFVLAPIDTSFNNMTDEEAIEKGAFYPVLTFDGQYLSVPLSGTMLPLYFKDIYNVSSEASIDFIDLCQIYVKLNEKGFTGDTPISDYLIGYFNEVKGVDYDNLVDLYMDHPEWVDGEISTANGIYNMTEQELLTYINEYGWIDKFIYAVEQNDESLNVQIKWPEPEIAVATFNSYYTALCSVVYGEENTFKLYPNGSGVEFSRSHAVGDYMKETALYKDTNAYFSSLTNDPLDPNESLAFYTAYGLDGPGIGNSFQNYIFSFHNIIELEVPGSEEPEEPEDPEDPPIIIPIDNELVITKTISGNIADPEQEFTFKIELDLNANGNYGGVVFSDGVAYVTLKAGESAVIENLAPGTNYTVTEIDSGDYIVTSENETGTIPITGTINVTFNNELNEEAPELNTEDHIGYLIGRAPQPPYNIYPTDDITRAEVATIFFRLLTEDARAEYWTKENAYTDVPLEAWYNNAISTLSNMGIINGYPDGSFRPDASISRAEFITITVRFFDYTAEYLEGTFPDVHGTDWFADYVAAGVELGMIEGYPDGSFVPEGAIIRAEAAAIVNRTLGRAPDEDHLLPEEDMITWEDNLPGTWYYAHMQEASNSHDYELVDGGDGELVEQWTAKFDERDWAALERVWSDAYSAPGAEVVD